MQALFWYHALSDRVLQTNALLLCKRYYLLDRVSIYRLHCEFMLKGLERRRRRQLLRLMYLHSKNESNVKKTVRVTRAISKVIFKTASRCVNKYLNSPFYKGTILWNNLDVEMQRIGNVKRFVTELKKLDRNYQEMW